MNYDKNMKSIIRKHLLKEDACPTGWTRVPPGTTQDTTKFEYSSDNKCYRQKPESTSGGNTDLPTWAKDSCLSDMGEVKKTGYNNQVYIKGEATHYFYNDFKYTNKSTDGSSVSGTWECKDNKLIIKTPSNNQEWNKVDGWHESPKEEDKKEEDKKEEVKKQTQKKSKYTKCDETLPIKQWCKNDTIKKVQACLKMPPRFLTGNFGQNTQEYLESRGQEGKVITTQTIINVCGPNDPLVTGSGTSGASGSGASGTIVTKTGYENYRDIIIPEED